jgi:DNA-binding NtrC family response regulator
MKILIADDDPNLRKVLTIELSGEGFEIQATDSGLRALELIAKDEPDVMILDLNMPGLSGLSPQGDKNSRHPWKSSSDWLRDRVHGRGGDEAGAAIM